MKNFRQLLIFITVFVVTPNQLVYADLNYGGGLSIGYGITEDIQGFDELAYFVEEHPGDRMLEFSVKFFMVKTIYKMGLHYKRGLYGATFPLVYRTDGSVNFRVTIAGLFMNREMYKIGNFSINAGGKIGLGYTTIQYKGLGYTGEDRSNLYQFEPYFNIQHSLAKNRFIIEYECSFPFTYIEEDINFILSDYEFYIEQDIVGILMSVHFNYCPNGVE